MSEHDEQSILIGWCNTLKAQYPALDMIFAIPNAGGYSGGYKQNVARVQKILAEGVRPGIPDLMLAWPRPGAMWPHGSGRAGLFIEMKFDDNKCTPEQKERQIALAKQGYEVVTCWDWTSAAKEICGYLGIDPRDAGLANA